MKKFLVVAVVLAIACLSSVAFAADVTVNGYVDFRSRLFENLDLNRAISDNDTGSRTTTETAFRIDVNVKADNAKAKLSLWNDHDMWGQNAKNNPDNQRNMTNEGPGGGLAVQGSSAYIREAWLDVMIPNTPVGIKAGQQLMMISNGWFFRENYGGVAAWTVYSKMGNNTFAIQDVKLSEGGVNKNADDVDLYTAMGTMKMGDKTLGIDLSMLKDDQGVYLTGLGTHGRRNPQTGATTVTAPAVATGINQKGRLYNVGLNFNGKIGAATIKAEADVQQGEVTSGSNEAKSYTGNQVVVQATMPMDKLTLNATAARGSGQTEDSNKYNQFFSFMDIGQHYTMLYEYRIKSAASLNHTTATTRGATNTGFANTTALNVGAMYQAAKSVAVGADLWYLRATEAVALNGAAEKSRDLGTELDVKVNWQISKEVSWNWQLAYFNPGSAYNTATIKADDAYGAQGILSLTF
jgi:hypothetical protein